LNILLAHTFESILVGIFLEEISLVSKFCEKMEKEKSLNKDDEIVQTSKRSSLNLSKNQ